MAAGRLQHPLADGDDHSCRLGNRNEIGRGYESPLRIVPTQQRLETDKCAGRNHGLRLIVEGKLVLLDGAFQCQRQLAAMSRLLVHLFAIATDIFPIHAFGAVHGQVGPQDEVISRICRHRDRLQSRSSLRRSRSCRHGCTGAESSVTSLRANCRRSPSPSSEIFAAKNSSPPILATNSSSPNEVPSRSASYLSSASPVVWP